MKFYIPIVSIFLINSVASEVCYAGGMKDHPLSANTEQPPCWYKSSDGTYSCFDLVHGACPFPGNIKPQDATLNLAIKKPESANLETKKPESVNLAAARPNLRRPTICFRGNMKDHPVIARISPPCWYREKGYFSCYEIDPKTKKCPAFPNRVKRPPF